MKLNSLRFHSTAAFVADIHRSKQFYTEVLGQEIELDFGKNVILKSGITLWEINPNHIIPRESGIDTIRNERVNRFEFYFESEDIHDTYQKLSTNRVAFLHSVHEEPWGQRTIRFYDPDHRHLIEIGESMTTFVSRMSENGMSTEAITRKIGIPAEKLREIVG